MSDELKDQAIFFVLGMLEAGEKDSFLTALVDHPELGSLVDEYRAVFAALSVSGELKEPPAVLRLAILDRASATFTGGSVAVGRPGVFSPPTSLAWLVAACLAVASVFLFFKMEELERERDEFAELSDFRNLNFSELEAQSEAYHSVSARVAWSGASGVGMMQLGGLPPAPPQKSYQLWVFEEGVDEPVSAGVFDPASESRIVFRPDRPVSKAIAFAVSVEVAGGRPQPEGQVIFVGKVAG